MTICKECGLDYFWAAPYPVKCPKCGTLNAI